MNEKRLTVYTSYTLAIDLTDVAALAPSADLTELVAGVGNIVANGFGERLVGYAHDIPGNRIYITFKYLVDAKKLAEDWRTVVDLVYDEETRPDLP